MLSEQTLPLEMGKTETWTQKSSVDMRSWKSFGVRVTNGVFTYTVGCGCVGESLMDNIRMFENAFLLIETDDGLIKHL